MMSIRAFIPDRCYETGDKWDQHLGAKWLRIEMFLEPGYHGRGSSSAAFRVVKTVHSALNDEQVMRDTFFLQLGLQAVALSR